MQTPTLGVEEVLDKLLSPPYYEEQVGPHGRRTFPACKEQFAAPKRPPSDELRRVLRETRGIRQFYTHQARALDALDDGRHVVVATATSSGKSAVYQIPTLTLLEEASAAHDHSVRVLWMFPTKALSRDQLDSMEQLVRAHAQLADWVQLAVHDGDTAHDRAARRHARENAHIILTNPDTLHMSLLPHADRWHGFYRHLRLVVLDELHVYTGGFGAHVAVILRRLRRMCAAYGNDTVRFISCSATIANPVEHMACLFGLREEDISLIEADGAPHGRKEFLVWNPPLKHADLPELGRRRSILEGARLLAFLVEHRVRSILFCRTRKVCELVLQQLHDLFSASNLDHLRPYVASYRSGYDPVVRRQIEKDMFSGRLLAVVATSALELGIDIGSLDAVVLVGVPWDKAALRQQIGRVGRRQQTSLAILVADEQPLDQYYSRCPDQLFDVAPAVAADWSHPSVLGAQLQCAAHERVIHVDEDRRWFGPQLAQLCQAHLVEINAQHYRAHPDMGIFPPGQVAIRGRSNEDDWSVIDVTGGRHVVLEVMDAVRALFSIYEGAIYLYQGRRYLVNSMDVVDRYVTVQQVHVSWLTQQRDYMDLDPLETLETRPLQTMQEEKEASAVTLLTATVFGYYKIDAQTGKILDTVDVDMPSVVWTNPGVWMDFPAAAVSALEAAHIDTEEAVHGVAHLCRHIIPSFVLCGAEDVRIECKSPLATRYRPPRLVIQDTASGIGASLKIYARFGNILREAYQQVRACTCADGCPQCINSPLCTERNQALSKAGACLLLAYLFE
ncbi:P-loop containing nucleoside triphosphate hydrolase protein [Syncephalis pseudoplumigaleata]|uniref:P-loop containing nucleoside triphosphate hydrolase protein n=1 Tax=Syncephalis pseudoplumigaleata TaxID=1712513 RepID=A0A4P9Z2E1_9FUNG|nr:P-loop containing nucleoside triphosphate hydrolase protein [Syncephalis pseudoplumigaleata]|eukprot:RKP26654.1 P-loop containing nucleoside triphosphate hydrolase protein [Syncephalis pseudoplumigaleata]